MYIIGFEDEKEYKRARTLINDGDVTTTIETGDIYKAVAREEAKCVIDNRLINVPYLYYGNFNSRELQESIEESLINSDTFDLIYREASDIFDKEIDSILGDRLDAR